MKRHIWRLVIAAVISTSCYVGTVVWYNSGKIARASSGKSAVARLAESINEVQRKETKRVIWESVGRNDELFPGEAIRTTDHSEAKIQLLKSGTIIHLEPDSLVVLEENDSGLALDFLQGNLFVQGGGTGEADNITLKTGSGEISLKSADMSLSKDQSGQVNLEVFKGNAQLKQGSQKIDLSKDKSAVVSEKGVAESKDRLQLLSPTAGQTVLLNLTRGEHMELTWKPLGPEYRVFAEVGASRGSLSRVPDVGAGGESGRLTFGQKPGKWFLRLNAQSADKTKPPLVSMVIPFTIEPKTPPALVQPAQDTPFLKQTPEQEVEFKWLNRNKYAAQVFELAKDKLFATIVKKQSLEPEAASFKYALADGTYFWRVTGFLKVKDKTEALTSPSFKLEVASKWEFKPATLIAPANLSQLSYFDAQKNGVTLKWQPPLGVTRFKVLAQRKTESTWKTLFDGETEASVVKLTDIRPGAYQWKVTSLDPKGGAGKSTEMFEFAVDDMPKLEWAQSGRETEFTYSTPTPSLRAEWKPLPTGAASYRFRVSPEGKALEETAWQATKQTVFDVPLPEDGKYTAIIEAMNSRGQTIAQTDQKSFLVKRLPLLPAPRWAESTPKVLKTDGKGNLSFGWEEVEGAKQYLMILENGDGQVVDQKAVSRNGASLSRLKPGQYQIKLKAVDSFRRPSAEGEARKVEVPNTSDIRAPKIKAMKVK